MYKYELLHEYVANNEKNICEITAIKNGEIVFDQGFIKSVDQKVYF